MAYIDRVMARLKRKIENLSLLRKIAFNFTKLDSAMQNKTVKKRK